MNSIHLVKGVADCQRKTFTFQKFLAEGCSIHPQKSRQESELTFKISALIAMDQIKEEIKTEFPDKAEAVAKDQSACLWEGKIRLQNQMGEKSEDILAPIYILHKDDSKNGCRLFDWTSGKVTKIHFPLKLQLQY